MKKKKSDFKDSLLYIGIMGLLFTFVVPIFVSIPFSFVSWLFEKIPEPFYSISEIYLIFTIPSFISYIILFYLKENSKLRNLFKFKSNYILRGLLLGFLFNIICVIIACLTGSLKLSFSGFNIFVFLFSFVAVFVPAASEELFFRGYIQGKLYSKYRKPIIAILVNSVLFSLYHISNDGISLIALLSIFVVGVLLSVMTYYNKNIWEAIFFHTAWNFCQSILMGLPNSGVASPYSVFKVVGSSNNFAYNTVFGLESSIVPIILFSILIICIQLINNKKQ